MPAIHFGPGGEPHDESWLSAIAKLTLAVAAIGFADYLIFTYAVTPRLDTIAIAAAIHVAYFVVAYWIRPESDESDMGLLGPFMDDPFSVSDDTNRGLMFIQILLLPGQLSVDAIVFFVNRCFTGRD